MVPLPLSVPIVHETQTALPATTSPQPPKKKRKTKDAPHVLHASTFRKPLYTYFHLSLLIPTQPTSTTHLDPIIVSQLLTQALSSYFGLTGAAIPMDIVKTAGNSAWIRCPLRDGKVLRAGLSGWVGKVGGEKCWWRVVGEGVGCLAGGDGGVGIFGD